MVSVESVDKRERRLKRSRQRLAAFEHSFKFLGADCLRYIVGIEATWESVRRVSEAILGREVRDIPAAWAVVEFVRSLPDGGVRLEKAMAIAIEKWSLEIET